MKNLTAIKIAEAVDGILQNANGQEETEITCAVVDSRKIEKGGLFFAAEGEKVDGHKFIRQVTEAGASLIIATKSPDEVEKEHGIPKEIWPAYIQVSDSYEALKKVAKLYRSSLTIPVIGITGSVGKTSTKEFIAGVLSEKYQVLKTEGNFNNEIGLPLTLLRIRDNHQVAVVEMGISDFGEMSRLGDMARPDICVITNIGQCHLENLHSREGIRKAKTEIFDYLSEKGEVCLNGDDDMLAPITEVHGKKVHFFGIGDELKTCAQVDAYATDVVSRGLLGSEAVLHLNADVFPIRVSLPGAHMISNATVAAMIGKMLGLSIEEITAGIAGVKPLGGRCNLIEAGDRQILDDCYNANPVSMKAAIDMLNNAEGRKVALLGDMFELGANSDSMHASVGEYAVKEGIDVICCTGENSRHMYEAACASKQAGQDIYYFATREDLLSGIEAILQPGDTILVKASHGMGFTEVVEALKK